MSWPGSNRLPRPRRVLRTQFPSGGNPQYDADAEARRWLAAHPRASVIDAWQGGWSRAWSIARRLCSSGAAAGTVRRARSACLRSRNRCAHYGGVRRNDRG